jgi:hypothetical protein
VIILEARLLDQAEFALPPGNPVVVIDSGSVKIVSQKFSKNSRDRHGVAGPLCGEGLPTSSKAT